MVFVGFFLRFKGFVRFKDWFLARNMLLKRNLGNPETFWWFLSTSIKGVSWDFFEHIQGLFIVVLGLFYQFCVFLGWGLGGSRSEVSGF